MHDQELRGFGNECDRLEITREFVRQLRIESLIDRVRARSHEQRVAVRGRFRRGLGADLCARARTIVDDHGLAETRCQAFGNETSTMSVEPPAGYGMMSRTTLTGYCWAATAAARQSEMTLETMTIIRCIRITLPALWRWRVRRADGIETAQQLERAARAVVIQRTRALL